MNLVRTRTSHFATCLGPPNGQVEHEYCTAHFSGSKYRSFEELKAAYEQHVLETGHRVHVGRFACVEPERQMSMEPVA